MKALTCSLLLAAATAVGFAAETQPAPPAASADAAKSSVAGKFDGTWQSADGEATGKLKLALKPDGEKWTAEASFTYKGAEVPTKLKSVKVAGAKVELVFEYVVDDTSSGSTLVGELSEDKLSGSYETFDGGRGTWSVKRA